ncbi:MAG: hypothetical protein IGR80_00105 [Synechococcales cyanobacterium K44_A2020_017]|nr:hypothetical protein [Synechococcales cyanobacterium K32_A2020_035]MBF2093143.1 hypothetical protein [Synechococcales cyanobacterium K44_A2020_017]
MANYHVRISVLALATFVALPAGFLPSKLSAQTPPTPTTVAQQSTPLAAPLRDTYAPGEAIAIDYSGLPGNRQDWITLVDANAPDDTYGDWFYTDGQRSGRYTFDGLEAGTYEVRVYFNWPDDGYQVRSRYQFTVGGGTASQPSQGYTQASASRYRANEPITIQYSGLPGNNQDWITLVPSSAPDDTYGDWFYTSGQRSGSYTFNGVEAGTYEVRVYFNWPDGGYIVQGRDRIVVE